MNPLTLIDYLATGLYMSRGEVLTLAGLVALAVGFVLWVTLSQPRTRTPRVAADDLAAPREPEWNFPPKDRTPAEAHLGKQVL